MVMSDPTNSTATSSDPPAGPNNESAVNYALASDDGALANTNINANANANTNTNTNTITNSDTKQSMGQTYSSFFNSVVSNKPFQNFILFLILINCIMMGIATTNFITQDPELVFIFDAMDFAFLIIFTIELLFGFGAYGLGLFQSAWLTFDFFVVTISWLFPTFQVIRGFRSLRLLSRISYVRHILYALHSVMPVMGSIVVLLSVIFYVAAVIFTELFGEMYEDGTLSDDYFGNLGKSLFTLFQVMTGAGWPDIAREVMETYSWAWFPFVLFVTVTMFVVVELTIAALCKSISVMEMPGSAKNNADVNTNAGGYGGESSGNVHDNMSDSRIHQLEGLIDRLTRETNTSPPASTVGMGMGEVSDPAPQTPLRFSWKRRLSHRPNTNLHPAELKKTPSSIEWYDKLSLSNSRSGPHPSESESSERYIEGSYNCFPDFIQSRCAAIASNERFHKIVILLIVINSLTMGLATYKFIRGNEAAARAFNIVDFVFLVIFTIELLIQLGYRGSSFFKSGWVVFDLFVISLSWIFPEVQVARAFRCVRLFSRVRFMRTIITALGTVAPKLAVIGGLLLLMFYIMSIIFLSLFKDMFMDGLISQDYFGGLGKTAFTLFQCMTISGWPDIAREVMLTYEWAWFPFVLWIIISKFTIIQLVVAILCQSLAHVDDEFESPDFKGGVDAAGSDEISRLEAKMNALATNIDALMLAKQSPSSVLA